MEEEGAVTGELLAQWRVQPRGQDIGASDASQGLRGNRLERSTSAGYRLVSAVWKETQCSEHVGASFARVWIRETVQRGRSYPMDAGELVRLHCNLSAPFIIPYIAMNGFSTAHSTRRARAKCVGACSVEHTSTSFTGIKPSRILLHQPLCHHPRISDCFIKWTNSRRPSAACENAALPHFSLSALIGCYMLFHCCIVHLSWEGFVLEFLWFILPASLPR